jgi:signal transduction histidine kinase
VAQAVRITLLMERLLTYTGQGAADRALEPFYSTKGEQGTGLGLAICRRIIDNHRGTIRLDSTPGAGTIVTITLPWAEATRPR